MKSTNASATEYMIAPPRRFSPIDWAELWRFRGLFVAFTWRDIVVRSKQTALGFAWVVIRPILSVVVLTVVFNRLAQVPSDGAIPYPIFVLSGLLFWQYYADVITNASMSMVQNAPLLQKVYFPRLMVPMAAAITASVDAIVAGVILVLMMLFYGFHPQLKAVVVVPVLVAETVLASLGIGLFAAAVNIRYRDVRHVLPFTLEILKYLTPVIYPAALLDSHPVAKTLMLWLNPIAGVIKEARNALLEAAPTDWLTVGVVGLTSTAIFICGVTFFRSAERYVADVI